MQTNALPHQDVSVNTTGCCPKFNPEGWDTQDLHFDNKLFVRVTTRSVDHVPQDMAEVFEKTFNAILTAEAYDTANFIVLSRDMSAAQAEHFFAVTKPVPDLETVRWSGDYVTRVFEGPYENAPDWEAQFQKDLTSAGTVPKHIYYFYTMCPKCAADYGKNYVVAVAAVGTSKAAAGTG